MKLICSLVPRPDEFYTFFLGLFFFGFFSQAQHIGCVTLYDHSLCEKESEYVMVSSSINWTITKGVFQDKVKQIIAERLKLEGAVILDVYFWVNDYNSLQAIKIQGWHQEKKFMITFPLDFHSWDSRGSSVIRRMDNHLPYPLDYGFQLGELLVTCKEACQKTHFEMISQIPGIQISSLAEDLLVLKVQEWQEIDFLNNLKTLPCFENHFRRIELSPIVEANGYSQLAFRFTLTL